MTMAPGLRKFALTVHLTFSVGWIGAVVAYLALGVAAVTSQDVQTVRAAWIAMELTGWFVIAPLSLASPLTGLVSHWHHVGLVPALLGPVQTPDKCFCRHHLADVHADA